MASARHPKRNDGLFSSETRRILNHFSYFKFSSHTNSKGQDLQARLNSKSSGSDSGAQSPQTLSNFLAVTLDRTVTLSCPFLQSTNRRGQLLDLKHSQLQAPVNLVMANDNNNERYGNTSAARCWPGHPGHRVKTCETVRHGPAFSVGQVPSS